jgi:hypothetical protein
MPWPIFFKTIGITYGLYYSLLLIYELIRYYRNKSNKPNEEVELDTSYLYDIKPQMVSDIITLEEPKKIVSVVPQFVEPVEIEKFEGHSKVDIEDIDNSLNVLSNSRPIEEIIERGRQKFSDFAKDIY